MLSGTASDGTVGLEAIKERDGITFAQDDSARYDSMPRSAIAAGCVDFVLPPAEIARELGRIAKHPYVAGAQAQDALPSTSEQEMPEGPAAPVEEKEKPGTRRADKEEEEGLHKILALLRRHANVDFSNYKVNTIQRRVMRRVVLNRLVSQKDYARLLDGNGKELDALYADLLINVTSFFRNPEAFAALRREVFPKLLRTRRTEPVRVWVAGCASGQEAYSLAMALTEYAERASNIPKLQIFATDLSEALLEKARAGLYPKSLLQELSAERVRRFFVEEEGGFRVVKPLRDEVVFARQDLLRDPPFSRLDLISCRNLMIYLEPSLQQKIIPVFHYALKPEGFLFLGASESIGTFTELFEAADRKHKIYARKHGPSPALHLGTVVKHSGALKTGVVPAPAPDSSEAQSSALSAQREADRVALNRYAPPGVVLNADWQVLQFRGDTSPYLKPPDGKASFDVLKMAREDLKAPLRTTLKRAERDREALRREDLHLENDGHFRIVSLVVVPLINLKEPCFLVFFEEPQERPRPQRPELAPGYRVAGQEVAGGQAAAEGRALPEGERMARLKRELAETRDYLQSLQEQHEAANEELQASNEEVTSANEELQSINEELETSKEELESSNEELLTVNEEMANRNVELGRVNSDLINFQSAANMAIVLLARDQTVRRFTAKSQGPFNLTASDVGRSLHSIRLNLDIADLEELVAGVMDSLQELEREVRDKDGRWYSLRVRPYRSVENTIDGAVLVLVDIDALKRNAKELLEAREYTAAIVRTTRDMLVVLDANLHVHSANEVFYETFHTTPREVEGRLIYDLGNGQWNIPRLRELLEAVLPRSNIFTGFEVVHDFDGIGRRVMMLNARALLGGSGQVQRILLGIHDITEQKRTEDAARRAEAQLGQAVGVAGLGIFEHHHQSGVIEYSALMRELLGFGPEEPVTIEAMLQRVVPEDREALAAAIRRAHDPAGDGRFEMEHRVALADGRVRWVSKRAQTFFEGKGSERRAVRTIGAALDVTERKEAQAQLEQLVQERTARLRELVGELEHFSYSITHDMRAPLRGMIGYAELLAKAGAAGQEQDAQRFVERIRTSAERMDHLITDALNYSRALRQELALSPVDLGALLRGMLDSYPELQPSQARIEIRGELPRVMGNPAALTQCFSNLLGNAVKFVKPGEKPEIVIWAEVVEAPETRRHGDVAPWVRIWVEDKGIGIAESMLGRVFDMFSRGQSTYEGTGIGLALVRKVADRMGGKVGVESEEGDGSRFWVELESAERPQRPSAVRGAEQAADRRKSEGEKGVGETG